MVLFQLHGIHRMFELLLLGTLDKKNSFFRMLMDKFGKAGWDQQLLDFDLRA